MNYKFSQEIYE